MQRTLPGNYLVVFVLILNFILVRSGPCDEVENLVVSAARGSTVGTETPLAISVITREEIRLSGALNLVDAIRSISAVNISDLYGDGSSASVGIRGFSETAAMNTLVMIDGRRLNNADSGLLDINSLSLDQVERIEIATGSSGTLYGDKAVGGFINIITRPPGGPGFSIRAGAGSYGHASVSATAANSHANGIFYRAGARRQLSDNYRDRNKSRLTGINFLAGLRYESGEINVALQSVDENLQNPGALFTDQLMADRRQAQYYTDFVNSDTWSGRYSMNQEVSPALQFFGELTRREDDTRGVLSSAGVPSMFTQQRKLTEFTPRVVYTGFQAINIERVTVGSDLYRSHYRIASPFGVTDDTQDQYGFYIQGNINLTDSATLTMGARYNKVKNDIYVDTLAFGRSLPEGSRIDDAARAWEAGISWQPLPELRVFARVDRNFRFVSADEYSAVADNNFFSNLFGFGGMVPLPVTQTGTSYESGLDWQHGNSSLGLQLYFLELDNEIVFDPLLFLNTNIGATSRTGLSFNAGYTPAPDWDLDFSYSFIDTRVTDGRFVGSDLTYVAKHTYSMSTSYRFTDNLTGYVELSGISDRVLGGDFSNTLPALPGYITSNMNLVYRSGELELSLRVNNLTDNSYSDNANTGFNFRQAFFPAAATYYPAPGRNFFFTMSYSR